MTEVPVAPAELVVLEFPGSKFNGSIIPALIELVDDGIVRIADLALIVKDDDGSSTAFELSDLDADVRAQFDDLEGSAGGLLSDDDLAIASEALRDGSSALVIVWIDTWAARLAGAVLACGGRLVAHDRLDAESVAAALATVDAAR
ncbi:MAG TPA: DUF6325 family protein [Acidimicrobiales bacterium]|nr:DUF6325 family protein [Acidimicrobiales bacterium]